MSIKIESYHSNTPTQCFACQRFGHSSLHYSFTSMCIKCAGSHLAKNCFKPRESEPKWINCEVNHTFNYFKWSVIIQQKDNRRPSRINPTLKSISRRYETPTTMALSSHSQPTYSDKPLYSSMASKNLHYTPLSINLMTYW